MQKAEVVGAMEGRGRKLRPTKQRQFRAVPNGEMPHLGPLERGAEWTCALKVLSGHKNGANAPRDLIINEL